MVGIMSKMQLLYGVWKPSPFIYAAFIMCLCDCATLHLRRLVPRFTHVITATPLLVVTERGMDKGLKGLVTYRVTLTFWLLILH